MELLERDSCITDLTACLEGVVAAGGRVVLLCGEAGIGKTALVQQFVGGQHLAKRALWGACDALFTPRPLGPLHDIARQTGGALLEAVTSGTHREAIFRATLDELERGRAPAIVVFEDMHWADEATLDLLKFIGRRIRRTRVLLIVTFRDDEVGPRHPLHLVTPDLPRDVVRRMRLEPLSAAAVAILAERAGRAPGDLYRTTGGNPFFVTEALAGGDEVPATVREAVLARAARLPVRARELAEVASVVPGRVEAWLLEHFEADDRDIEACLAIGMNRADDGSLVFRHELARRALEDSLAPGRLRALHARLLAALERGKTADVPHVRLVHHADGCADAAAVLRHAPAAAEQAAQVGAHREAASHYRIALRYVHGQAEEQRARLLQGLAYECYLTQQIDVAIEARRATLEIWRRSGSLLQEGNTLRWLSRLHWIQGRRADAEEFANHAVAVLEALPAGPELAMAYSNRAQLHMFAQETDLAVAWADKAIAIAEANDDAEILSHALNNRGSARFFVRDESGCADLQRSLVLALDHGLQEHVARAYTNLGSIAVTHRLYDRAIPALTAGLEYSDEHDLDSWSPYIRAWLARVRFERGEWDAAGDEAEAVVGHTGRAAIIRMPAVATLARLRVRRGDPGATALLDEALALAAPTREIQRMGPVIAGRAEHAWLRNKPEELRREAALARDYIPGCRDPWSRGELVFWLWKAGDWNGALDDVAEPFALQIAGEPLAAANAWSTLGCPYEHAEALAETGDQLRQREALEIFERLGAAPAARALRQRLHAQGVRGLTRGAHASTRANPHGLTTRELSILGLIAGGLRNAAIAERLFLSPKTISHHVSAILGKLGVTSRVEAAVLARELGLDALKTRTLPGKR